MVEGRSSPMPYRARVTPSRRLAPLWITWGSAVLTGVLVAMPNSASGGGLPHPATVFVAPFKGFAKQPDYVTHQLGCGNLTVGVHPFLNLKSGLGGFSASASAPNCGMNNRSGGGFVQYRLEQVLNLTHSDVNVSMNWTLHAVGNAVLKTAYCNRTAVHGESYGSYACDEDAISVVALHLYMDDLTSPHFYSQYTSSWSVGFDFERFWPCNYHQCGSFTRGSGPGSGNFSVNRTVQLWLNVTSLNLTHKYILESYLDVWCDAGFGTQFGATFGGGSARAFLDMGNHGRGVRLNSITIT